jgi:hypothetical protein
MLCGRACSGFDSPSKKFHHLRTHLEEMQTTEQRIADWCGL